VIRLPYRVLLGLAFLLTTAISVAAESLLRVGASAGPFVEIVNHVVTRAKAQGHDIKVRYALALTTRAMDDDDPLYRSPEVKQVILERFARSIMPTQ
jgi:hypothetical protein